MGPCCYVWKKSNPDQDEADIVMYVGQSWKGIRRFAGHHVLPDKFHPEDYIEVYPCYPGESPSLLEDYLIRLLKPRLNKNVPDAPPCGPNMLEVQPPRPHIEKPRKTLVYRKIRRSVNT